MSTIDPRHLARLLAIQVLYEADTSGHDATEIVQAYSNMSVPSDGARSASYMVMQSFYDSRVEWGEEDFLLLDDQEFLPSPETYPLLLSLVSGVTDKSPLLDEVIAEYAPEYPLEQLAVIDRNVLRIALYELFFSEHVPEKVAINEAVRLAKLYGSDASSSFINGVLGMVVDNFDKIKEELKIP